MKRNANWQKAISKQQALLTTYIKSLLTLYQMIARVLTQKIPENFPSFTD